MPRQPHRTLLHAVSYTLIALALLLTLLPQIVGQSLRYTLVQYGAGAVEIDNVDINLFNGTFAVDGLQLYRSAAQLLYIGHAEAEIDWRGLLKRRIDIRRLQLDNTSVTLEQSGDGALRIAGFTLPAATAPTADGSADTAPWGIGIGAFTIEQSSLQWIRPGLSQTLFIDRLSLGAAQSWAAEQQTPLSTTVRLAESSLSLEATARPFAAAPDAAIKLHLKGLDLALAQPLLNAGAVTLSGKLGAEMELSLQYTPEQFTLAQSGGLHVETVRLQQPQMTLRGERFAWQGKAELKLSGDSLSSRLEGGLSARALSLQLPQNALQLTLGALEWKGQLALPDAAQANEVTASGSLELDTLAAGRSGAKQPHTTLKRLALQTLTLDGVRDIRIDSVQLTGLQGQLTRTQQGLEPLDFHRGNPRGDTGGSDDNAADNSPPTALRIGSVALNGDSRVQFEDRTVKPVFNQQLSPKSLRIGTIDSRNPNQATPFNLEATTGEHSRLSVNGEGTPLAVQPGFSLQASLQDYEMPPLTSYLVKQIGYRINSGQLDSGLTLEIADNQMQGELKLKARQLDMQPEDPARIEEFEQKSNMPVNTALGLLRDDDNNIALSIPLSGQLDDPKFDLSDAFNTALAKTMRSASVSYLKYLLQPYSSVITLVQLAGKAGGGIRLEPVSFEPGSAEISEAMLSYSEKLAELARKDPKLQLRLCGFATPADKRALGGDKQGTIAAEGDPELEALAKQRAEALKRLLVDEHGIAPGQLFICHPSLDRESDGVPRVELQL